MYFVTMVMRQISALQRPMRQMIKIRWNCDSIGTRKILYAMLSIPTPTQSHNNTSNVPQIVIQLTCNGPLELERVTGRQKLITLVLKKMTQPSLTIQVVPLMKALMSCVISITSIIVNQIFESMQIRKSIKIIC